MCIVFRIEPMLYMVKKGLKLCSALFLSMIMFLSVTLDAFAEVDSQ